MFRNRERILFFSLIIVAAFFVVLFFFTRSFINQMRKEEHQKIEIWAEAINQQAKVVSSTSDFFAQLQKSEYDRMMFWTEALKRMLNNIDFDYNKQIVASNTTIPYIEVDMDMNIYATGNDNISDSVKKLEGRLLREYSKFPPIVVNVEGVPSVKVYFKASKVYTQLQEVLSQLVKSFIDEVVNNSVSVPVLMLSEPNRQVVAASRLNENLYNSPAALEQTLENMFNHDEAIKVEDVNGNLLYKIYYEDSQIIQNLKFLPYIFSFFILIFILVVIIGLSVTKKSEDNRLWVSMSKETAHQLGTPISSLIAWNEILKEQEGQETVGSEIEKDILRLQTISQRFSKIGSIPHLEDRNISEFVEDALEYLKTRLSKNIVFNVNSLDNQIIVKINPTLMQWVIENMLKNATDAIGSKKDGKIDILIYQNKKKVIIEIKDNGKGMPKSMWKKIFYAGFTTKTRGWGLGLALCKRIICEYHKGKVFVLSSIVGSGSTFRIVLR